MINAENDKLNKTIKQLQISFARERSQISDINHEQLQQLRLEYENKMKNLEEELTNQRNNNNIMVNNNTSDDSNSMINSNTSFEEIKDENCSIRSNVSSSLERNFLEEILSTSNGTSKSSTNNGQNLDNLTQLLAESENNINLLSEQNRLLKEEIRRLQRNFDRVDIADNLEYLKNILLKDEQERLIGVLSIILKLTTEETAIFHEFLTENLHNNKSLTSSWNLWQWS
ncbi:hypothetical protein BLA29_009033 [Euroglyphus maynei]|uniref:GRIP domain-containing protein n=1 Tax=Euroglyphus maynei TaxID=6958 RepID=A0A1Y3B5C6_EURMA|nr:hypothetical protein BLA29_009033 [Euroglyphus maynei]